MKPTYRGSGVTLPDTVPIFPLPNVILFPEVEVPLYIFEPRYRMLLADCAAKYKFMGISLFREGWQSFEEPVPSHDVIGVGYIRAIFENEDGTSHILIKGVGRAKIEKYMQMEPYRVAKIRELPDRIEDKEELEKLATSLKRLLSKKIRLSSERPQDRFRFPKEFKDPVILSHVASFFSEANPYLKQDLLETTNANNRIRYLIDILHDEIYPPEKQN